MASNLLLNKDIKEISNRFPKLRLIWYSENKIWLLTGELDICDKEGNYWETFEITIVIPNSYPYCIPRVFERSKIIPREKDRHISEDGLCCIDIEHHLLHMSKRGIRISEFITQKVYSYFANQLYFNQNGYYAGGEYAHHFEGVRQFYADHLNIKEVGFAILVLEKIIFKQQPGRNDECLCGSKKKVKRCHIDSIEFLKSVGEEQLKEDLRNFRESDSSEIVVI